MSIETESFLCWLTDDESENYHMIETNTLWIKVKPSAVNNNIKLPSHSVRGGKTFDLNGYHLICLPIENDFNIDLSSILHVEENGWNENIHIYLAGTGSTPTNHNTANWWLYNSCRLKIPTISLSYQWGNHSDVEKNNYCENIFSNGEINSQDLIDSYHKSIVFGGDNEMISVDVSSSIHSRIKDLLIYLKTNGPFKNYWDKFIINNEIVNYNKVIISGHSQGSGHACYLAKHIPLKRCILISGPQELLDDNSSWLDGYYETKEIYSFKHQNEEYTSELIIENWKRIRSLYTNNEISIEDSICYYDNVLFSNRFKMFQTSLPYHNITNSIIPEKARPYHNSTIGDVYTPRDDHNIPIYFNLIWKVFFIF